MRKIDKSRLLPIIPALWASLLDIYETIFGQPAGYWNGNLNIANERDPIGSFFMTNHVSGILFIRPLKSKGIP